MSLKFGSRSDSMRDMRGDGQVWTRFNGNASHRVRLQLLNAGDTQQFADLALEWPTVALKQRHRAAEAAITDPRWLAMRFERHRSHQRSVRCGNTWIGQ
jgi:hypothetical protein